eukprot:scaffold56515_cov19-Tisochrysis_lutea.AAC.3
MSAAFYFRSGACMSVGVRVLLADPPGIMYVVVMHAQGLKAFLLSSPYDCPAWMPRVLMALVRCASAASQEASLRSAAAKVGKKDSQ